jgi:hypothetical protein
MAGDSLVRAEATSSRYRQAVAGGALLLAGALALYAGTLDNGLTLGELMGGDLITHHYAQAQARFANAPGYPLYTMLGWLWFNLGKLLLGWAFNPVEILSLYSTLWALAALAVLYALLLQITGERWLLAAAGTAFYAVTPLFWYYAVSSEQYASSVFQTLLLCWLAFRWERDRRDSWLLWMAFVVGTCLANLVTAAFVVPGLLIFLLWHDPGLLRRSGLILRACGLALLPMLSYGYVYLRAAQHPAWLDLSAWPSVGAWFLEFLTAPQGREEMARALTGSGSNFPATAFDPLSWPVSLAGLIGWAFLGRRKAALFYVTAVIYLAFGYVDRFGNWYQVLMPLHPLLVLGAFRLLEVLIRWLSTQRPARQRLWYGGCAALLAGMLVWRGTTEFPYANQRNRPGATGLAPAWTLLQDSPKAGSCVAGSYEETFALQYLTLVWGARPDLQILSPQQAMARIAGGQYCYFTRLGAGMEPEVRRLYPSARGAQLLAPSPSPLRVVPTGIETGAGLVPVHMVSREVGDGIRLAGYAVSTRPAGALVISLFWQAAATPGHDYVISVRLLKAGKLIPREGGFVQEDQAPVWGFRTTSPMDH